MKVSNELIKYHSVDVLILSSDRDEGNRLKLADIQKLVDEDAELQNLSNAQKEIFIDGLKLHRETMKSGVRASNVAAAADCRAVVDKISNEVSFSFTVFGRTEVVSDQKFVRTHWNVFAGILHPYSHS
jgi:hypothetical protein